MKYGALAVTAADGQERRYEIDVPSLLVGSGAGSGILIESTSVAERHARLLVESGTLLVEDLGSEAGTMLGGRRLAARAPNRVHPGDVLRFGDVWARYIQPEAVRVGPAIRRTEDDEAEMPVLPLSRVLLTLTLPSIPVGAGGEIEGVLRIENRGRVVDEISLELKGIPPRWVSGWRPKVRLVTGGVVDVPFVIQPPVAPESLAGKHDVLVTARSGVDQRESVEVGSIEILPFEAMSLEVDPHRSERRFEVVVANEGNVPLDLELEVVSADERMQSELDASRIGLRPGETRRVRMRAGVRRARAFGRDEVLVFTVAATPHNAAFERVERFGQLHLHPRLQRWKLPLQALAALLIVAAVAGVFLLDWPVAADVDDFDVPAIPGFEEKADEAPSATVPRPAASALAGAKKDDAAAALAKLEERYAGVHLCGTAKDASATKTPTASSAGGPLFRQTDSAWANEIYAAAGEAGPKSTCGKSLAQCGCQVTSMATVLALLQLVTMPGGEPLDPGSLNRWFQQEAAQDSVGWTSRGYAYGDVVWSAANALSAEVARSTPGARRIRYFGAGSGADDEIRAALEAQIPVILEVSGHYIAATGIENGQIMISDPYYPERTTLEAYKGKVLGSVLFQPADDLSAITVTAGADMRIRVTDPSGRVVGTLEGESPGQAEAAAKRDIPTSSYTFKDAWRDPNCIESAPPVGAGVHQIHISSPEAGAYKVEVTNAKGGGAAAVLHVYDRDGNLRVQREEGTGNRTVTLQIN